MKNNNLTDKVEAQIREQVGADPKKDLYRMACSLIKKGYLDGEVLGQLEDANAGFGNPLEEETLFEIFTSAQSFISSKKGKKEEEAQQVSYIYTDDYILEQIYLPLGSVPTSPLVAGLAELAELAGGMVFLKYDKSTGTITAHNDHTISNSVFKPITDDLTTTGAIKLPSGIEEYGSTKELVEIIKKFLYSYFEVPKFFEEFIPYLVLFYWVYEKFPFIPYIHFVGLTGTGKTTAQEVMGSICYKPIDASGSLTLSPIFRTSAKWGGTLLLDEFEVEGDSFKEMLAFLKGTVGDKVILKTEGDSKREVKAYLAKSPKIFTSEQPINNAGLQSRTIVIKMEKNKRRIPLYRLGRFEVEAQHIRNKLLLWRFHHLHKINLDDMEYGFPELEAFDRRVQQVITPIYYFSDEETRKSIAEFAKIQQDETQRERRDSLEGQVFTAMLAQYPSDPTLVSIAKTINEDRPAGKPVSEKRLGSLVRKVFHFNIKPMGHDKLATVLLGDQRDRVDELCGYYGIPLYPQEPSATSASPANEQIGLTEAPENAGLSDEDYANSLVEPEGT